MNEKGRGKRKGILFLVSAPSGGGKTTLCEAILGSMENIVRSISYTTRPPRPGERDGVDYFFLSPEEFERRVEAGFFAEWARVHGHAYGTGMEQVLSETGEGHDMLFAIDVQGVRQMVDRFRPRGVPLVTLFILPPSWEVLADRLRRRGTDSPEAITTRLETARKEVAAAWSYDYLVVNDRLEAAISAMQAIIEAERRRTALIGPTLLPALTGEGSVSGGTPLPPGQGVSK
ncbi:MAG: guanylate kinase [Deltaproteobacteria bacterium]|nr:MAG: guanylate kinase [Deltaproteobacteria bacterium]